MHHLNTASSAGNSDRVAVSNREMSHALVIPDVPNAPLGHDLQCVPEAISSSQEFRLVICPMHDHAIDTHMSGD